MASKVYCDRCEKQLTRTEKGTLPHIDVMIVKQPEPYRGRNMKGYDFCDYHCLAQWAFDQHNYPVEVDAK
jgi:hypothetical protein